MRTTLDIDDDLMATVKHLARQQGATIGHVISQLARQSLTANAPAQVRNGVRVFASKAGVSKPGMRLVNDIRDDA